MIRVARAVGWALLLAGAAWLCVWSAVDRLAGQGALLHGPASLLTGGQATLARAWQALGGGHPVEARQLAFRALRRRGVDAAALRTAGLAAIATGDNRAGDRLMRLAGTAGWRDVPTQLYWAQVAIDAGALEVAAERLDAVRRASPPSSALGADLLRRLELTPAGRAALVRRLATPGNQWLAPYLQRTSGLGEPALQARLLLAALAARAGLDRAALDGVGWSLIARGRPDLAARLLQPGADLSFAPDDAAKPGPFAWAIAAAAGLDARVERQGRATLLHVQASGPAVLPIATRLVRLSAGVTRLEVGVRGARTDLPVLVTLECVGGGAAAAAPVAGARERVSYWLSVPPGCATQRLGLAVAGEEARRGADLWLAAPVLRTAAAAP